MDAIKLGQVTNADCYIDEALLIGRVAEFKVGDLSYEAIEHKALGQLVAAKLPGRTMDAPEATIKFAWLDADLMVKTALPNRTVSLQLHSYVDVFDQSGLDAASGYRLVTTVDLLFSKSAIDAFKNGEAAGEEMTASVVRLVQKASNADTPIREFSVFDNINRVGGADVWPKY